MARTVPSWLFVVVALLLPGRALALDGTDPPLRIGAAAGLMGSLPLGPDVSQPGAPDEFQPALWVQVDALTLDLGTHLQLGAFFRLSVVGGYDGDTLGATIDTDRFVSVNSGRVTLSGLWGRYFPFETTRVRPYLSLGLGYATAGTSLTTCSDEAIADAEADDQDRAQRGRFPIPRLGTSQCPRGGVNQATRRHQGLGIAFGLGVRFDPHVGAYGERWLLPVTVELGYVKNVWLGMQRDPTALWEKVEVQGQVIDDRLQSTPNGVASNRMKLDFLGLLVTVGFLR